MFANNFSIVIAILATISLFLFSLKGFAKELQKAGAEWLERWLGRVTQRRFGGFLLGAAATAIIQSSSAVTSIVVALVESGVFSFSNSLAVLLGCNIGTTFTAWLVTFKISNLGAILLVVGTILGFLPWRIHLAGKSIFYLGLVLFSLTLINNALTPLQQIDEWVEWLSASNNPFIGVLSGIFITAILQSSSVVSGLVIILTGQGLLSVEGAIAVIMGANLGTTSTALIASLKMGKMARNTARANFLFNLFGLIVCFPVIGVLKTFILSLDMEDTYRVATAHLTFNIVVAIITFPFLGIIGRWIARRWPVVPV
ncbi:MAG TPA: Na/Pi symporter [Phnomibacter sp.]|nr:Na/Pi symporter [Phnomibacter sp.]